MGCGTSSSKGKKQMSTTINTHISPISQGNQVNGKFIYEKDNQNKNSEKNSEVKNVHYSEKYVNQQDIGSSSTLDEETSQQLMTMIQHISQKIPRTHVKEQYIIARRKARHQRRMDENPAPFIAVDISKSFIMKKRDYLSKVLEEQVKQQQVQKASEFIFDEE